MTRTYKIKKTDKHTVPISYIHFAVQILHLCHRSIFPFIKSTKYCLIPIRISWTSAGTIRAVPDTVKKCPGACPGPVSLDFEDLPMVQYTPDIGPRIRTNLVGHKSKTL